MVFRRIIYNAILVGIISGLLLSVVQIFSVNPVIFAAEAYEFAPMAAESSHNHDDHSHDHGSWSPQDGAERTLFTILSNLFAGTGFAAVLLALMAQIQASLALSINALKGVAWGLAGFLAVFAAPGIGLPPEIPGIQAAAVEHRQIWWALTVFCVAVGIGIVAFAPVKFKLAGMLSIAVPYVVGVPHIEGPQFLHPDPAAVAALEQLHQQFILASGLANLIFWLILGIGCALVLNRWVIQDDSSHVAASA